jgi:hypothetical protein
LDGLQIGIGATNVADSLARFWRQSEPSERLPSPLRLQGFSLIIFSTDNVDMSGSVPKLIGPTSFSTLPDRKIRWNLRPFGIYEQEQTALLNFSSRRRP